MFAVEESRILRTQHGCYGTRYVDGRVTVLVTHEPVNHATRAVILPDNVARGIEYYEVADWKARGRVSTARAAPRQHFEAQHLPAESSLDAKIALRRLYSARSASSGVTATARFAGTQEARSAASPIAAAVAA